MQRTILITGASGGLGAALARALAADHHHLAIHHRLKTQDTQPLLADLCQAGAEAEAFPGPLANLTDGARLLEQVVARFGRLDTLINNAGVFAAKHFEELTQEDWDIGLDSTVGTAFAATRAALPHLRASGRGRIINIGESASDRIAPAEIATSYYIGKVGVWMMTRTLAASEACHKVTVNMVSPGVLARSEGSARLEEMPLGRYGTYEDIVRPVRFLLEDGSEAITGSNLQAGGGWNLR
jgi:NAD(P)-dependent dehydrogenase (short-subunit alcohol dehydrogenase family)